MQLRHWLFFVSVLLFVSGIGFIVAAERTRGEVPSAEATPVEVRAAPPLATVKQMAGLIMPAAEQYWGAVSIWENTTDQPVTVMLQSAGFYNLAHEFRAGGVKNKTF